MAASSTVTIDLSKLPAELQRVAGDASRLDLTRAMRAVSVYLSSQAKRCFAESREPDGTPWPPLKNPSRRRGGRSAKPLIDTGRLMASMSAAMASGAVREVGRTTLEHGTNVRYAGWQNFGTATIPPRAFVGITPAMSERIERIVVDEAARIVAGAAAGGA